MSLAHRTINNAVYNTLGWLVPIGLSLLLVPYIVSKMGAEAYGLLALVLTVVGYFALLDLGLGTAVIKYVAEYAARDDRERVNEVIGTILAIFLIAGTIGGLAVFILSEPLATRVLKISPELTPVAILIFRIGSAGLFLSLFLSVLSAIPAGLNRFDITSLVNVVLGTATMLGTALLLALGYMIVHVVILNVALSGCAILLYAVIVKRLIPWVRFVPLLRLGPARRMLTFGLYTLLSRISYLVNYQADRIITGAILGIAWVTYYVVPFAIVNRITTITVNIGMVIFPAISELQGLNRHDRVTEVYLTSSRVIAVVATAICLPLFVFGGRLLTLWMGADFGAKAGHVIVLLTLGLFLSALTNVPTFVVQGINRPRVAGIAAMSNALLNVALAIPGAAFLGINGIAMAFLASNLVVTPAFVWYVHRRVLGLPLSVLLVEAYGRPFLAGLVLALPLMLVPQERIGSLIGILAVMALTGAGYVLLAYCIGVLPRDERRVVVDYVKAVVRRP